MVVTIGMQSAAAALETQLARAITNVEFDKEKLKDAPPADDIARSASNRPDEQSSVDSDGSLDSSGAHSVRSNHPSSLTPEEIEGMSREQLASSYKSLVEAVRISQQGQPPSDPPPIARNDGYQSRDIYQQKQEQPDVEKAGAKQREPLHPSPPKQRSRGSYSANKRSHTGDATPGDDAASRNRIYVDNEGRQFLLDGVQPNSGDQARPPMYWASPCTPSPELQPTKMGYAPCSTIFGSSHAWHARMHVAWHGVAPMRCMPRIPEQSLACRLCCLHHVEVLRRTCGIKLCDTMLSTAAHLLESAVAAGGGCGEHLHA